MHYVFLVYLSCLLLDKGTQHNQFLGFSVDNLTGCLLIASAPHDRTTSHPLTSHTHAHRRKYMGWHVTSDISFYINDE
jgi:hypothetical protein